jgi:hypothetical protein
LYNIKFIKNNFNILKNICVSNCPPGYYVSGEFCEWCDYSCGNCSLSEHNCTDCKANKVLYNFKVKNLINFNNLNL